MKTIATFATAFALLFLTASLHASHCGAVVIHRPAVVAHHAAHVAAVVTPVVATTYLPVIVPTYGVAYGNHGGYQGESEVARLRTELELHKLKAEIQAIKAGSQAQSVQPVQRAADVQPAPANSDNGNLVSALTKCASCHDAANAKAKGGAFTMFENGGTKKLTEIEALNVLREVRSGRMPRGGKLTAAEKDAISDWVAGISK